MNLLEAVGHTPLVELMNAGTKPGVHILCKLEGSNPGGSVKDRTALSMIAGAEERGELTPGEVILEPTSGNTGIAIAMIGAAKGYAVRLCMPECASAERVQILHALGAGSRSLRAKCRLTALPRRPPRAGDPARPPPWPASTDPVRCCRRDDNGPPGRETRSGFHEPVAGMGSAGATTASPGPQSVTTETPTSRDPSATTPRPEGNSQDAAEPCVRLADLEPVAPRPTFARPSERAGESLSTAPRQTRQHRVRPTSRSSRAWTWWRRLADAVPAHRSSATTHALGAGSVALVEAAQRFDPELGVPLGGFAFLRVRGAMADACRSGSRGARPDREVLCEPETLCEVGDRRALRPEARLDVLTAVSRLRHRLRTVLLRHACGVPSCEIAADMGVSESRVSQLRALARRRVRLEAGLL